MDGSSMPSSSFLPSAVVWGRGGCNQVLNLQKKTEGFSDELQAVKVVATLLSVHCTLIVLVVSIGRNIVIPFCGVPKYFNQIISC